MAGQEGRCEVWLHTAAPSIMWFKYSQQPRPYQGGGVIPKGTLRKSCRSLNYICLHHFGRGGSSRKWFFKEKSHSWTGLPEKHLFFFGLLWAFQESQACAKKRAAGRNSGLVCVARESLGVGVGGGWYWNVPVHLVMSGQQKIVK